MLLADVAAASEAVAATPGRLGKVAIIADLLRRAAPDDVALVVTYLSGELRQRRTGLGYAALRDLPPPASVASLQVGDADAAFQQMADLSGKGSAAARRSAFAALMSTATASEQRLVSGLVSGELRQGAAAGVMTEAVAAAGNVSATQVRAAVTMAGSLVPVATALLAGDGLGDFRLRLGTPLSPMLAQTSSSVDAAFAKLGEGPAGVEWKLDGIRVQVHRDGDDVAVFSRSGDDLTAKVPDLVAQVRALPATRLVVDGEAIVLRPDGRPERFQVTGSRVGRLDVAQAVAQAPLTLIGFDLLHHEGVDLVGETASVRWAGLDEALPPASRIPRLVTDDAAAARDFVADALKRGHEGGVLKAVSSLYVAGRRGTGWVKVKPRIVLDLVVLAAEWGHGRRSGRLSNIHLGALDPAGTYGPAGGFVMLGKTFKGMTDVVLAWQTQRFADLAATTHPWGVQLRPEQVVEIAVDGVQVSSRYPAGVALRFARVLRYRDDKPPAEADTVERVRALLV